MKAFFGIGAIALALLLTSSEAYFGRRPSEIDPAHPGQCVWKDKDTNERTFHPVGTSWKSGECEEATCVLQDGELKLDIPGCAVPMIASNCRMLPMNTTKPYPECCPRAWCPKPSH